MNRVSDRHAGRLLPLLVLWIGNSLATASELVDPVGNRSVVAGSGRRPNLHEPLDPVGRIHIPIGIPNTVDTLKTFVEAEGPFSPGCGSYGVYCWMYDPATAKLTAPTMEGVACTHGLPQEGCLIPWSRWSVGSLTVTTSVCEVQRTSPAGEVFVVGAKAELTNAGEQERKVALYLAVRPLGPAGFAICEMTVADDGDALLVERHPAVVCDQRPNAIGVSGMDEVGHLAMEGKIPKSRSAASRAGDCSGVLRFDLTIPPGATVQRGFVCPVLPGRRAVGHRWDGRSPWAQLDLNAPHPSEGGQLQPDPGLAYYREIGAETLFEEARAYWRRVTGQFHLDLPDPRWPQALAAMLGHAAMSMNEGAPDVAVVNYNVFNRDGVYVTNILQKSGQFDLAEKAIEYFLTHPFNGRVQVEADNPGQVLWAMGQHWLFSRHRAWLDRVYPSAAQLAAMIRYYRTTPEPHYVKAASRAFGDSLPPDNPDDLPAQRRQVLRPGACDGTNPNYTQAFDVAGLRAAALLAEAAGRPDDARAWSELAASLLKTYDAEFGSKLPAGYGSYCVLWPCRLYPLRQGSACEQFKTIGAKDPTGWRYFPLATAHQGLLAGNREAGYATIEKHLAHEQMAGWYAFDEGGASGPGGWRHYRTTWKPGVAMPHGWAIAEMWLLMRDALVFEDADQLVLLGGIDPAWFADEHGMVIENLPTHFGRLGLRYEVAGKTATLTLAGTVAPLGGFVLRSPPEILSQAAADGRPLSRAENGEVTIPPGVSAVTLSLR